MLLEGSCHCKKVRFTVESHTPYPFSRCYCSTCRKLNGGGGYTINIMAQAATLTVEGEEHITASRSALNDRGRYDKDGLGYSRRHFCKHCGTMLWNLSPLYPDWIYPFASAIDTPLPAAPEHRHTMLDHKAPWVEVASGPGEQHFPRYADEGIEDWHRTRGLYARL
jgi:hypothetical protein